MVGCLENRVCFIKTVRHGKQTQAGLKQLVEQARDWKDPNIGHQIR
jgi:hypothetical protein